MNAILPTPSQGAIAISSSKTTFSEIELLLCCSRTRIDIPTKERIEFLLQQDLDWTYIVETSARHGVMQLLYQSLKKIEEKAIPQDILTKLQFNYRANYLRNYYLAEQLVKILNRFQQEGITAVPFKGASLAITAYNNLSSRYFVDLDILVDRNDFLKAKEILLKLDFEALNDLDFANTLEEDLYFKEIDEFAFIKTSDSFDLICDLHQGITVCHFRKCKIELTKLQDWLQDITFNKSEIQDIKPEYLLILLCIHASRHFWEQLNWVCDLNELIISNPQLNWQEVTNEASLIGCKYHLLLGLHLANYYLETKLPPEIEIAIAKSLRIKYLSKYIKQNLFISSDLKVEQGFNLKNFSYQTLLTNGWQGYQEIIEYFVFPSSKDKIAFNLPSWLSFLYYFLRPFRLLSQLINK